MFECPYPRCMKTITKPDVETYLNLHDKNVQKQQVSYGCCPTVDCPYVYSNPNNRPPNPKFECPVCDAKYCLKCKKEYHFGKPCLEEKNPQPIVK